MLFLIPRMVSLFQCIPYACRNAETMNAQSCCFSDSSLRHDATASALPQMLTQSFMSSSLFPLVFDRAFLLKLQCLQIFFFLLQERLQLDWAFRRPFAIECTSRESFCIGPLLRRHHYHALIVCIAAGR